ncbi:hypothetical protein AVEN_85421-1 [Araneus ventricosus]|uniref:Uncharacterized protein n=1 Tax=Araneus ventricosus TaxID=182803 RepID=A0A4Y2FH97_ARAVE|nr:hypothetical protein AVEN_85421-1 [Araneus ventricosus]
MSDTIWSRLLQFLRILSHSGVRIGCGGFEHSGRLLSASTEKLLNLSDTHTPDFLFGAAGIDRECGTKKCRKVSAIRLRLKFFHLDEHLSDAFRATLSLGG